MKDWTESQIVEKAKSLTIISFVCNISVHIADIHFNLNDKKYKRPGNYIDAALNFTATIVYKDRYCSLGDRRVQSLPKVGESLAIFKKTTLDVGFQRRKLCCPKTLTKYQ